MPIIVEGAPPDPLPVPVILVTAADLAAAWRALSDVEAARANVLIAQALRMIRRFWPDVDARVAAGLLDPASVTDVVVAMVERRMSGSVGTTQSTESYGPFSKTALTSERLGELYFLDSERAVFDVDGVSESGARSVWVS